jgi:hypothetical protein
LITGGLSEVWGMVNSVQLLAYIRHMNLYFPSNAEAYFDFMIKVADFEYFDLRKVYDKIFDKLVSLDPNGWLFS